MEKTITAILRDETGWPLCRVTGEPVIVGPHTFILHRMIDLKTCKQLTTGRRWRVSDPVTGAHITKPPMPSKAAAIKEATERVTFYGFDKVELARAAWLKRYAEKNPGMKMPTIKGDSHA